MTKSQMIRFVTQKESSLSQTQFSLKKSGDNSASLTGYGKVLKRSFKVLCKGLLPCKHSIVVTGEDDGDDRCFTFGCRYQHSSSEKVV